MSVPRLSAGETSAVLVDVLLPLLAKGVVARRPRVVGLAARLDTDGRAIRRLARLRGRYGPGPLLLRLPGRDLALMLSPDDVHRDSGRLPQADSFCPEIWLDGSGSANWAFIPFSDGPAACPGRSLVLFLTSSMLAGLLERHEFGQAAPRPLNRPRPLPATLNSFGMRFALAAAPG
jgi:Cytochrome P450